MDRGGLITVFIKRFRTNIDINLAVTKDDGVRALSPSASISARKTARFSEPSRSLRDALNITTPWVMFSDAVAWRATSIRVGADRKYL